MEFLCERLQIPLEFLCANRQLLAAPLAWCRHASKRLPLGTSFDRSDHAGLHSARLGARLLRPVHRLRFRLRPPLRRKPMLVEYVLGGVVTVVLLVYLTWALLRPEKF